MEASTRDKVRSLLNSERIEEARALCLESLGKAPDDATASYLLALADYRLDKSAEATERLHSLTGRHPERADIQADLGRILALEEDLPAARHHLEIAVRLDPRHHDAWHNLGLVLRRLKEREGAFTAFKQALRVEAKRPESFLALGDMLLEDGQKDAAIQSFRLAVAADPGRGPSRAKLAQALADRGHLDEAERLFHEALSLAPRDVEAWLGLGYLSEDRGDRAKAEHCYRQAMAVTPGHGFAIGRLLALVGPKADSELIRLANWALDDASVPNEARALVGYGLGKVREAAGDAPGAFQAYAVANQARRRDAGALDRGALIARIDRLIRQDATSDKPTGSSSELPVFIVGMPRSGTTLAEQILASHPAIHGAGELSAMSDIAAQLGDLKDSAALASEAETYLKALRTGAPPDAVRIIDKAPLNFFHLGLIARLFPKARVIHCTRDPRDVCFSAYSENFAPSQTHATDLSDLAFYWAQYRRLMDYWQHVLPLAVLELPYERTVGDLEATARSLCRYVDVPWDERCLAFHSNDRVVRTPSRWQVRQPIYGSSIGRWRRFAAHLGPLLQELPPPWNDAGHP